MHISLTILPSSHFRPICPSAVCVCTCDCRRPTCLHLTQSCRPSLPPVRLERRVGVMCLHDGGGEGRLGWRDCPPTSNLLTVSCVCGCVCLCVCVSVFSPSFSPPHVLRAEQWRQRRCCRLGDCRSTTSAPSTLPWMTKATSPSLCRDRTSDAAAMEQTTHARAHTHLFPPLPNCTAPMFNRFITHVSKERAHTITHTITHTQSHTQHTHR